MPQKSTNIKLGHKEKALADARLNPKNIKKSNTQLASEIYNVSTRDSARAIAAETLAKPSVLLYMEQHINKAQQTVVEIMTDTKARHDTRLRAADSLLDRTLGKPIQHDATTRIDNLTINFGSPKPLIEGEVVER